MNKKPNTKHILVTGSDGQLGQCLKKIESNYLNVKMHFTDYEALDITKKEALEESFLTWRYDFVINCAAYTNVEQAEKEPEKAFKINAKGVKNIAEVCLEFDTTLIHISTDYVFDGKKNTPYTEEDLPNPINEYGKSKLAGEQYLQNVLEKYFIIRTSWLYSEFGHNFFKTILRKSKTETELTITTSEKGTPTNANDLSQFILNLVISNNEEYGIYHYSNMGEATWYDFAKEILKVSGKLDTINLKKTNNYPTFAVRPKYSVLSKTKVRKVFGISPIEWIITLKKLINDF